MDISEARTIRDGRAVILGDLREQRRWVEDVLRDPPRYMGGCSIGRALRNVHRMGEKKVWTVLNEVKVSFDRKICDLTDNEVEKLIKALPPVARKKDQ